MQIDVLYPELDAERRILLETTGAETAEAKPVLNAKELREFQLLVRQMPVGESVIEAILELVRSARPDADTKDEMTKHIAWGPGPRASQALMLTVRARALLQGRLAPSIDDVLALAEPVLQHRMALSFSARADGITIRDVIAFPKTQSAACIMTDAPGAVDAKALRELNIRLRNTESAAAADSATESKPE